jgi:hypothetical protein
MAGPIPSPHPRFMEILAGELSRGSFNYIPPPLYGGVGYVPDPVEKIIFFFNHLPESSRAFLSISSTCNIVPTHAKLVSYV